MAGREKRKSIKIRRTGEKTEQLDVDTEKISDQRNVKMRDLKTIENKIEQRVKERWMEQMR